MGKDVYFINICKYNFKNFKWLAIATSQLKHTDLLKSRVCIKQERIWQKLSGKSKVKIVVITYIIKAVRKNLKKQSLVAN
jgi:hypothetical protein